MLGYVIFVVVRLGFVEGFDCGWADFTFSQLGDQARIQFLDYNPANCSYSVGEMQMAEIFFQLTNPSNFLIEVELEGSSMEPQDSVTICTARDVNYFECAEYLQPNPIPFQCHQEQPICDRFAVHQNRCESDGFFGRRSTRCAQSHCTNS